MSGTLFYFRVNYRGNNKSLDKTFIYSYNGIGNITKVESYSYTTGEGGGTPSEDTYEKAPTITMELAKKIARQGGHIQSARQIIRNQKNVISATRNSIDDIAKISKSLGKVLLVADIAWSLGENILSGEDSWLSDTVVDASLSLAIYGLSFLPGGFFISLAATAVTFIFEEQIEQFKDAFYLEWNRFWGASLI